MTDRKRHNPPYRGLLLAAAACCFALLDARPSPGSGVSTTVPLSMTQGGKQVPGFSPLSGMNITVDTNWVGRHGYRPVDITVNAQAASQAERLLTVKLSFYDWNPQRGSLELEHDFALPAGATSCTTRVMIPQYREWNNLGWETWVDGRRDQQMSNSWVQTGGNANNPGEVAVVVLGTKDDADDANELLVQLGSGTPDTVHIGADKLTADWTVYSCADVVCIDAPELVWLSEQQPKNFAALMRWVRAGGNLWLLCDGFVFDQLPPVTVAIEQQPADPPDVDPSEQWEAVWQWAVAHRWKPVPLDQDQNSSVDWTASLLSAVPRKPVTGMPDSWPFVVVRPYGTGLITMLDEPGRRKFLNVNRENQENESALTETLGPYAKMLPGYRRGVIASAPLVRRLNWEQRHGNDPDGGNIDFNNWLIPGFGEAPVTGFQILISLFVIGIGPVNYWLLRRAKRLPLLLVTVPVAAGAVTLLLLAYGLLSDGLGVNVRARSFTFLDQRAGESATLSRLSYYAGLAPGGGLVYGDQTVVYPILPYRSYSWNEPSQLQQNREIEWVPGEQRLTKGWIGSRTPTQYLTVSARPNPAAIRFTPSDNGLEATNNLGADIVMLAVQDHENRLFMVENIDEGQSAALQQAERAKIIMRLRELIVESEPQSPPGAIGRDTGWGRSGYGYDQYLGDGVLESQIAALVHNNYDDWGPGSFVAVTKTGVGVELGTSPVTQRDSFHVLRGVW